MSFQINLVIQCPEFVRDHPEDALGFTVQRGAAGIKERRVVLVDEIDA